ncbi:DUF3798 domain-containing protein [Candidatus Cryosericum hinesii]|jgi:hypothetical protein|uniref:DUF3798 domain-containing protein n=2 Tax=Candidatus Cryosericum hinesii TaxID=2290915 RepID=A0A398DF22_9BACT|nr:DUF3798 domain-containing protein [Candidatus Cryosericum hinesii]RIE13330.1 DUF3798 domain-containing protein [Candidatus Cryosericum hinesii]RIE15747.1 DUF3798 domain-containing protein [Candidatus Cryosericum hinesii]
MLVAVVFAGCKKATTPTGDGTTGAKYHIGIVTGTVSQGEDGLRGGDALAKEYGTVANGGIIQAITYPDNFSSEQETVIADIVGLADDPLMKAIVVNQAVPGTTEAFKEIRAKRSDILLFAGSPQEDPNVIDAAADVVTEANSLARGYLMIWSAKQLGAKNFVHISFARHMSIELLSRRWAIMQQAGIDLGVKTYFETAPDPTSDVGVAGAQQFILEHVPTWVQKYGKDTAFFCTNDAETEPLLKQIMKYGGMLIETDSPTNGYPGAFGIDLTAQQGDWPAILKKVESTIVADGGTGRFASWAWSLDYTTTAGLGEYAKRCIDGTAKVANMQDMLSAFEKYTPGAAWNASDYTDLNTSKTDTNHFLIYQDTYVFGKGYLGTTKQVVPTKYLTYKAK